MQDAYEQENLECAENTSGTRRRRGRHASRFVRFASVISDGAVSSIEVRPDAVVAPKEVVRVPFPLGVQKALVVASVSPKLNLPIVQVLGRFAEEDSFPYLGQGVSHLSGGKWDCDSITVQT